MQIAGGKGEREGGAGGTKVVCQDSLRNRCSLLDVNGAGLSSAGNHTFYLKMGQSQVKDNRITQRRHVEHCYCQSCGWVVEL